MYTICFNFWHRFLQLNIQFIINNSISVPFISGAIPTLQRNWYDLAIDLADTENLNVNQARITKRLTRFYFKDTPPEKSSVQTFAQVHLERLTCIEFYRFYMVSCYLFLLNFGTQVVTDRMFLTGIYEAARAHSQIAPTYSYVFDFNGKYNMITNYGYPASEWGIFILNFKLTFLQRSQFAQNLCYIFYSRCWSYRRWAKFS